MCIRASCTSDADCGKGLRCASYPTLVKCGYEVERYGVTMGGLACQTAKDECASSDECPTDQLCTAIDGVRVCMAAQPCSS